MANRRYFTPASTYSATYSQVGIDESHPVAGETTDFYQKIVNNIKYCYDHLGSSLLVQTPNADGFTLAGGTISRAFTLISGALTATAPAAGAALTLAGNFITTGGNATFTVPAAGATLNIAGNLSTTGANTTVFAQGGNTTQTLPVASSFLVGSTVGILDVVAPAAGATMTLGGSLTTSGVFDTEFVQGASTTQTLPVASSNLVGATGGVLSVVAPVGGATLNLAADLQTTGAFKTTLVQGAIRTFTLPTAADGWLVASTGGRLSVVVPVTHATLNLSSNFTTTGAFTSSFTQSANAVFTLPGATSWLMGSTGTAMTTVGAADGFTIAGGTASRQLSLTGGALAITAPVAGAALTLAGNLVTTGGAATLAVPAGGSTVTLAADVEFSGAFKPTFSSSAAATFTLPGASSWLMGSTGTAMTTVGAADGFTIAGGTASRQLSLTGGALAITADVAGVALGLSSNFTTTGAFTTSLTQSGNTILALPAINATLASTANITGKKGTIRLDPHSWVDVVAGAPVAIYAADDAGTVGTWTDGSKVMGLRWNNTVATTATVAQSFPVPADCDVTVVPTLYVRAAKTGATAADTPTLISTMYAATDGALYDAGANLGATTAAMANPAAKTVQLMSVALSAFPGLTSSMTITLNPQAAELATDDLVVIDAWIEYTKALG